MNHLFQLILKELRENRGISQAQLARNLGKSQSTVAMWERGTNTPNYDTLVELATYFDVSVDYLCGVSKVKNPAKPQSLRIPVLGDVAAGIPIEAITDIVDYEEIDVTLAKSGDFFGLRIKGASMEPRMKEGDVVIVRKQDTAETGDTVVVLVNGDSATVKKIKYGPDGITLLPSNPSYDPLFYSAAEVERLPVRVIGRVVELRAKY